MADQVFTIKLTSADPYSGTVTDSVSGETKSFHSSGEQIDIITKLAKPKSSGVNKDRIIGKIVKAVPKIVKGAINDEGIIIFHDANGFVYDKVECRTSRELFSVIRNKKYESTMDYISDVR